MSSKDMNIPKSSWDEMPIRSATELRALFVRLKESVASGEMQQYWPVEAPFATETRVSEIDPNGHWPADYIEWYFLLTTNKKRYKLTAETYHGRGGCWKRLD
jgi:hypothetical protein